jgi:hypothetical protein
MAHLNGKRIKRFDEQFANGLVDGSAVDALADRFGLLDALALADVLGTQAALAAVVTNRHAAPASTTDHESLKKCWTLTRRATAPVGSDRLCALMQTLLILLVLFPGQITGVGTRNQRIPLVPRGANHTRASIDCLACMGATIDECAGIPRVVQNAHYLAVSEAAPQQFTLVRTFAAPSRKRQLEMMRGARGGHCRSRTSEGVEQPPQAVLDLLVRIGNHRTRGVVHEADGQAHLQFTAPRFA